MAFALPHASPVFPFAIEPVIARVDLIPMIVNQSNERRIESWMV
jgi:hypothetical protein